MNKLFKQIGLVLFGTKLKNTTVIENPKTLENLRTLLKARRVLLRTTLALLEEAERNQDLNLESCCNELYNVDTLLEQISKELNTINTIPTQ